MKNNEVYNIVNVVTPDVLTTFSPACPTCGTGVIFGNSNRTVCEQCGREVWLVSTDKECHTVIAEEMSTTASDGQTNEMAGRERIMGSRSSGEDDKMSIKEKLLVACGAISSITTFGGMIAYYISEYGSGFGIYSQTLRNQIRDISGNVSPISFLILIITTILMNIEAKRDEKRRLEKQKQEEQAEQTKEGQDRAFTKTL